MPGLVNGDPIIGRWKTCVENWPECETFKYDQACCRWPKNCSAEVFLSEIQEYPERASDVVLYPGWYLAPNNTVEKFPMTTEDPTAIPLRVDPLRQRMTGWTYHGNHEIDVPYMTEITDNLWQGGCESSLELPRFIEHVINLYPGVHYRTRHRLESELRVRMYDSVEQGLDGVMALAGWVNSCRRQGPTLVHCQAGLNRSSLVVATALMLGDGMSAADAIAHIREQRSPACLCNRAFEQFLYDIDPLAVGERS